MVAGALEYNDDLNLSGHRLAQDSSLNWQTYSVEVAKSQLWSLSVFSGRVHFRQTTTALNTGIICI